VKKEDYLKEAEHFEQTPLKELLKDAEPVEVTTPASGIKVVLSLRLDGPTIAALEKYAEQIGQKPTVVARELIREGLERGGLQLPPRTLAEMLNERLGREEAKVPPTRSRKR
jgi:hypothetical protein